MQANTNNMKTIATSATRITLLLLITTLCIAVFTRPLTFEETFKSVVLVVVGFYFGGKTNQVKS